MSQIESVLGRQVLDSRGNPTVEVEVTLASGATARAAFAALNAGAEGAASTAELLCSGLLTCTIGGLFQRSRPFPVTLTQ